MVQRGRATRRLALSDGPRNSEVSTADREPQIDDALLVVAENDRCRFARERFEVGGVGSQVVGPALAREGDEIVATRSEASDGKAAVTAGPHVPITIRRGEPGR